MTKLIVDSYGREHEIPGPYASLGQVKAANRQTDHHWFDPDSMTFFGSRLESSLQYGRLFLSSEQQPTTHPDDPVHPRKYTVRCATDDGAVVTVGGFQTWPSHADAMEALHDLATGHSCRYRNWKDGCVLAPGHEGDHQRSAEASAAVLP